MSVNKDWHDKTTTAAAIAEQIAETLDDQWHCRYELLHVVAEAMSSHLTSTKRTGPRLWRPR
jgi:hypothetical protein